MRRKIAHFKSIFLLPLLVACQVLVAQPYRIGSPIVQNYSNTDYHAGPENWAVDIDRNTGFVYFGNNDGLLSYDGVSWKLNRLPNRTVVRSVAVSADGRIYVGGQGTFGYFDKSSNGQLEFTCLSDSIEKAADRNFDDVWRIYIESGSVLFTTYKMVARYRKGEKVKIFPAGPNGAFEYGFSIRGGVFAFHSIKGLCRLDEASGQFETVPGTDSLKGRPVKAILPFGTNRSLIPTQQYGIFVFDGEKADPWLPQLSAFFKKVEINSAVQIAGGNFFAFATKLYGVLIFDTTGRLVAQINKEHGLPNDNVLSIQEDSHGDLWLGLHNGVAKVMLGAKGYFVFIPPNTEVGAHSAAVHNGRLWLATTNGLFYKELSQEEELGREFQMVEGSAGDAWNLTILGETLLLGHDQGAFLVRKEGIKKISPDGVNGFWRFQIVPWNQDIMIAGNYSGLVRFRRDASAPGGWRYDGKIKGIEESCRIFEFDKEPGYLWMTHVYKGAFRLKFSADMDSVAWSRYGKANGLASDYKINVFKIDEDLVFGTEGGVYQYDQLSDRFKPHEGFQAIFGDTSFVSMLVPDQNKEGVWYVANGRPGYLKRQNGQLRRVPMPELDALGLRFKADFEYVYPIAANQTIFGAAKGFYLFGDNLAVRVKVPSAPSWHFNPWLAGFAGIVLGAAFTFFFYQRRTTKSKESTNQLIPNNTNETGIEAPSGLLMLVENAYARNLSKLLEILQISDDTARDKALAQAQKDFLHFLLQIERVEKDMMLYLHDNRNWKKQFGKEYGLGSPHWKVAVCIRDGQTAPSEIKKTIALGLTRIGDIKIELRDKVNAKDFQDLENHLHYYLYPFLREAKRLLSIFRDGNFDQEELKEALKSLLDGRPVFEQQLMDYTQKKRWMHQLLEKFPGVDAHDWPYLVCVRNEIGQNDAVLLLDYPSPRSIDKHRADLKKSLLLDEHDNLNDFIRNFGDK